MDFGLPDTSRPAAAAALTMLWLSLLFTRGGRCDTTGAPELLPLLLPIAAAAAAAATVGAAASSTAAATADALTTPVTAAAALAAAASAAAIASAAAAAIAAWLLSDEAARGCATRWTAMGLVLVTTTPERSATSVAPKAPPNTAAAMADAEV